MRASPFASVATQLANILDAIKSCICKATEKQRDIASKGLGDQWRQLVLRPMSRLDANFPRSSLLLLLLMLWVNVIVIKISMSLCNSWLKLNR